MKSPNEDVAFC